MLIVMGISFYTSRVVLRELGVSDYGIYSVVGGVVATFSSLRGVFASSIQRFLNFEMGRGNKEALNQIFSMGVIIHIILCVIFLILAETVGLWFLNYKLVIAPERMDAANWVYQFSVFASIATIMTIPYDAVIIANERMKAFAYISIIGVFLKLGVIFLISAFGSDKLKFYAVLIFLVSLIIRMISAIYCRRNFQESKFKFFWDKVLFKELGSFAGWNFFGNTAYTFSNEGLNILLNIFGGTPINAARGIAYQVRNITMDFVRNILMAINPRIIKLYSQDKKDEFYKLLYFTSKASFFVLFALCVPIMLFATTILQLWLVNVPPYTVSFVQLILIYLLVRAFHSPIDSLFKALGKIRNYQIIESIILFLTLPVSYVLLKNNMPVHSVFIVMIIFEIINLIVILYLAKRMGEINLLDYSQKALLPCFLVSITAFPISYLLVNTFKSTDLFIQFMQLLTIILVIVVAIILLGLNNKERKVSYKYAILIKDRIIRSK